LSKKEGLEKKKPCKKQGFNFGCLVVAGFEPVSVVSGYGAMFRYVPKTRYFRFITLSFFRYTRLCFRHFFDTSTSLRA
jgi:hypothetical protein